jgi:two-component system chemotaxis sensor kinase CheA
LDDSILAEFLVDSHEGLDQLDRDFVTLEHDPASREALASAFRALHTVKGTCSFFGFRRLERVAHAGEALLAGLRAGKLALTPAITGGLLAVVDTVRRILAGIEADRREPEGDDSALFARLAAWLPAASGERAAVRTPVTAPRAAAGAARGDAAAVPTGEPSPAPPSPAAPAPGAETASALQQQHVRVDVRRLDQLMDLVGELVLARNQLLEALPPVGAGSGLAGHPAARAAQRLDHVTTRLQDEVMRTRMQPVSALWARLPRLVRDVASACGKSVRLEMEGNSTELDRTLVEALKDPLTHLVRNAVDHGIEPAAERERAGKPAEGVLALRAFQEGGSVHLLLSDDGAGMSLERIRERAVERGLVAREQGGSLREHDWLQFVFLPGFSTAARVTSISGRGVGLDAARAAIETAGGSIEVSTSAGRGTTFHIRLPLTLAIVPALIVEQSGDCHAIPQAHLLELVRLGERSRVEMAHDRAVFRLRGELLPVVRLGHVFGAGTAPDDAAPRHLLVLSAEGRRFGLVVDRVRDTEEIVVKPIPSVLREGGLFAGATVRGDGRVALILDVQALAACAGLDRAAPAAIAGHAAFLGAGATSPAAQAAGPGPATVPLLLVRTRGGLAAAVRVTEVERIVELEPAAFERFGASPALRVEQEVVPADVLAGDPPLDSASALGPAGEGGAGRTWPVLLHSRAGRRRGLVVDAVEDIVEWPGGPDADRVVIRDRVTDLVALGAPGPGREAA